MSQSRLSLKCNPEEDTGATETWKKPQEPDSISLCNVFSVQFSCKGQIFLKQQLCVKHHELEMHKCSLEAPWKCCFHHFESGNGAVLISASQKKSDFYLNLVLWIASVPKSDAK